MQPATRHAVSVRATCRSVCRVCTTPTSGRSRSRTLDLAISHQLRDASLSTSCHLYYGAPREPKETGHQRRIVESSSPCMACVAYLFCGISCPRLTPVVQCNYFEQCDVHGLTYDRLLPFFFIDFVFASKWPACSFASQTNSA